MVSLDKAVIARLKIGKDIFEVWVDCEKALELRHGKGKINDVLATPTIFKDAKRGLSASENEIEKLFYTKDMLKVAEKIIKEGEIQLTSEYRAKLRSQKEKQIIDFFKTNAIDARTGLAIPQQRIEAALHQIKIKIDEFKPIEVQIPEILKQLKDILPIKLETREVLIKIQAEYAPRAYPMLKSIGSLIKEDWLTDGSFSAVIKIPAGLQEELENKINSATKGNAYIAVVKKE